MSFTPAMSTDEICVGTDYTVCLTDTLEEMETDISGKAPATHTHTGYAAENHTHTEYASTAHTHTGYASSDHTHSDYALTSHSHTGYASSDHTHTDYALTSHTHTGYAAENHIHSGYATVGHSHSNYAAANHTHSNYASSTHNHDSSYFSKSGGTIGGDTNITGVVRVNSKQMIYDDGSMTTFGTNNQSTMIAGSQVYSKTNIVVSSDARLKRDINYLHNPHLADFVDKLKVASYNYNDDAADAAPRIGLIAQDVVSADSELSKFFVTEDENGMLGIKTADLVFALVATVQELKAEIDVLKATR